MSRRIIIAAALLVSGCSVVVGGTEPPTCSSNDECSILNTLEGIGDSACERYQCDFQANRCLLGARDADRDGLVAEECASSRLAQGRDVDCNDTLAGGREICNGLDDDCDGVIDEGGMLDGMRSDPLPAAEPAELATLPSDGAGRVGYGAGAGGFVVGYSEDGNGSLTVLGENGTGTPQSLSYARAADLTSQMSSALETGCHTLNQSGVPGIGTCNYADLDVAPTAELVFGAAVSATGCGAGTLRVGLIERMMPGEFIERGPLRRSNVFTGVDLVTEADQPVCTGASRGAGGVVGAARPSVAAEGEQALVAYLADAVSRDACGGTEVDVEVLGLHAQSHNFGGGYSWVTGSNEGIPQVVGSTTGGGRPAVGVWPGTGYLVAYGNGSEVRLRFVDALSAPPTYVTGPDPDDRTGLETEALTVTDLGAFSAGGVVDDVVMFFGAIRDGGVDVGLAWREGCGSGSERAGFRQIFLANDAGAVSVDEAQSHDALALGEPTAEVSPPAITYVFNGMLEPGIERPDGRPIGEGMNDGGWIVAWADTAAMDPGPADDRRVVATRISEADGLPLETEALIALSPGGDQRRLAPFLYREGDATRVRIRYGFLTTGGESTTFRGGALTCLPPGS